MRRRVGLMLTALTAVTAACGRGGTASAPTTVARTPTTRPSADADQARATRALLVAVDVPGYLESPPGDNSSDPSETAFDACFGNDPLLTARKTNPRYAKGPELAKGTSSVSSSAVVGETEEQARTAIARFRAPEVPACVTKAFEASQVGGVTPSNVRTTALTSGIGDDAAGLRVAANITSEGAVAKITIDLVAGRRERSVGLVTFSALGQPFPTSERTALVQKVVDRLAP